jgi:glutamine synthetase
MSAATDILKIIKEKEIEFVDLRFTDPRGKLQHMTQDLTTIDEDFLNYGTLFDGFGGSVGELISNIIKFN